jgi:SAM-dependent methyltransferase
LDIGCGFGLFAFKLATRSQQVDALEVEGFVLRQALTRHYAPNIAYQQADFLKASLPKNSYDLIVSIASIHHMDLELALIKIKELLQPSGKLLILGLYREETPLDYLYSMVSVPVNLIYLNWYQASNRVSAGPPVPTCPAKLSLRQIKSVANHLLPGFHLQRHLFWRYSLSWQKF